MSSDQEPQSRSPLARHQVFLGILLGLLGVPLVIALLVWMLGAIPSSRGRPTRIQEVAAPVLSVAAITLFVTFQSGRWRSYATGGLAGLGTLAVIGGVIVGLEGSFR